MTRSAYYGETMTVETFDVQKSADSIVKVSDAAAEHFKKFVETTSSAGIRLSLKKAGCTGYKYDIDTVAELIPADLALDLENGLTLYVDSRYITAVQGTEIDIKQQGLNVELVIENPNVKDECGCGESFSIQ